VYDHKFPQTQLDLPRKKEGEGEADIWNRLFLKLNPGWLDEIPSACKTPVELGTLPPLPVSASH
jgi:hypothetical protein